MSRFRPHLVVGLFAAAMVAVFVLIVGVIDRPAGDGATRYSAAFTDANGLLPGSEVRNLGLSVGRVDSISLDGNLAVVRMSIGRSQLVNTESHFAIRYQSLTGQRYVDVTAGGAGAPAQPPSDRIPTSRTVPAFDVTELFNGLQPVLRALAPEDLNRLTTSMLALVNGDGSGLGPALKGLGVLADHAANRQAVISRMLSNLGEISDRIGGRSQHLATMLSRLADVYESLQVNMNGLLDFALTSPPVLMPVDNLLATIGLTVGENPDANALIARIIPDPEAAADVLSRLPAVIDLLGSATRRPRQSAAACSNGAAEPPLALQVLFRGQRVITCRS